MSRIGKKEVLIPEGVKVKVEEGTVIVSGPRGELKLKVRPEISVKVEGERIVLGKKAKTGKADAFWGLSRTLVANAVSGVSKGFKKTLILSGMGYRAKKEGGKLVLSLGFSHPITFHPPRGVEIILDGETKIVVSGVDKRKVGQVAAKIRAFRPPEPYKGKGIRYEGEVVRKKPGKAGRAGVAFGGK